MDHPIKVKNGEISPDEYARNIGVLANLEMIRVNQFQIIQDMKEKVASLSVTSERLEFEQLEAGFVYVITNIIAVELGVGTPQVKIGAKLGATDQIYESATVGNAEDSVEYIGQIFLKEGDKIFAIFEGATAADTAQVVINGYKIRRG